MYSLIIIWILFFSALLGVYFLVRYLKPSVKLRVGFRGMAVIVALVIIFSFSFAIYYRGSFTGALFVSAIGIQALTNEYNTHKLKLKIKELEDKLKHKN